MRFKITTLVENTVPKARGLIGEHGIAFYIEAGEHRVLFDTGQGFALIKNAQTLGIDLSTVEALVLSHGHYDHTGGLDALLSINRSFRLHAHPDVFSEKIARRNGQSHTIGLTLSRSTLESMGVQVLLDSHPMEVVPGVLTTGEIPMQTAYETIDPALLVKTGTVLAPDPLKDDLSLILQSPKGRGILFGCAHRGAINILTQVEALYGKAPLLAVVGGMHLMGVSKESLEQRIRALTAFAPEWVIPGHCTGFESVWAFRAAFKEKFRLNQVGSVLEI